MTGASIPTVLAYGCRKDAIRWAQWLISIQRSDGSMPDVLERASFSSRCTAQAVDGLLAILPEFPEAEPAVRKACEWLCSRVRKITSCQEVLVDGTDLPLGNRSDVLALLLAGQRWQEAGWLSEAHRVIDLWDAAPELLPRRSACCSQSSARRIETLIAMGRVQAARAAMDEVGRHESRSGGIRAPSWRPRTARLAQLAILWYQLNEAQRAERALARVQLHQQATGGFPEVLPRWPRRASRIQDTWAAKYYLDAALLRVRAAFEQRWQEFPDVIDSEDGRMQTVRQWMATLPMTARVADIGCGKGRYLRHLTREFPAASFTGLDISPAMLSQLPSGVTARPGSILRTGIADGALDGALAIEALEHSLVPQRAIAELCRIVRPGGRILVIDKDRRKQALSEHESWERWVTADELSASLGTFCEDVQVFHVAHHEGRPTNDLFLAAIATRRRPVSLDLVAGSA